MYDLGGKSSFAKNKKTPNLENKDRCCLYKSKANLDFFLKKNLNCYSVAFFLILEAKDFIYSEITSIDIFSINMDLVGK